MRHILSSIESCNDFQNISWIFLLLLSPTTVTLLEAFTVSLMDYYKTLFIDVPALPPSSISINIPHHCKTDLYKIKVWSCTRPSERKHTHTNTHTSVVFYWLLHVSPCTLTCSRNIRWVLFPELLWLFHRVLLFMYCFLSLECLLPDLGLPEELLVSSSSVIFLLSDRSWLFQKVATPSFFFFLSPLYHVNSSVQCRNTADIMILRMHIFFLYTDPLNTWEIL